MQIQPETIIWNQPSQMSRTAKPVSSPEVFRLQKNMGDRINGSMPVWDTPRTPEEKITADLANATKEVKTSATALTEDSSKTDDSFGFLDLVDMVNPLQHIPVVSTIYRNLTGDTIKPISRVIGGGAFGGPLGAAAGMVNALFQMETGKDVPENMLASIEAPSSSDGNDTTIALANLRSPQRTYNS